MKGIDRLLGWLPWFLGALIVAGIVHIASILAMPRLAPRDSWARMAAVAPVARLTHLPALAPGSEFSPFEDPAMSVSVCRFDLRAGPLRLRGNFNGDQLVLLSFHSRFGRIFYSMTDRSATRGVLDILVATPDQLAVIESWDSDDELPSELRLQASDPEGYVIIRGLTTQEGKRPHVIESLDRLACGVDRSVTD